MLVTDHLREAYDLGGNAFEESKDYATDNPFDEIADQDTYAAWRAGWMAAKTLTPDLTYVDKAEAQGEDILRKEGVPLLHTCYRPAQNKPWGCRGCTLFQYAPSFSKRDREEYKAQLKADRGHFKNESYCFEATAPVGQVDTMFVFESPSMKEDKDGQAFVGAGSHIFIRNAKNAGIDLSKCAMTFAVRCCAKRIGDKPTRSHAIYCSKFLVQDILKHRPKTIVTFGALPTQMVLGKPGAAVTQYQGVPQRVTMCGGQHECVVYPMLSPDHIKRHDYLSVKYADAWMDLGKYIRGEGEGVREDDSAYEIVTDVDDAIALCKRLMTYKEMEVDLETSGLNPYAIDARVSILSMSVGTSRGYSIPYNHDEAPNWTDSERKRFVREGLRPLLQRPVGVVKLIWHNGKFDYKWFPIHFGFTPTDLAEDTMLTHYACDENEEHGLKALALRWTDMGDYDAELDRYLAANFPKNAPRYDKVPLKIIGRYAAQDPVATRKLRLELKPKVEEQGPLVEALAYKALPLFSHALTRLEEAGCAIDIEYAKSVLPMMTKAAADSYDDIMAEPNVRQFIRDREAEHRAGMKRPKPIEEKRYFEFKLGSSQQLSQLLFDPRYYNHPVIEEHKRGGGAKYNEKTYFGGDAEKGQYERKKQPSTNKEVMNELAENHGSPIAKKILAYRLDHALEHTFTRPLIARVEESVNNLLHANILLHGTKTGRSSARDPNLQAIPGKSAGIVKRMFVSRYGDDGCIVGIDYSQIELRILAAIANDREMLEAYKSGADLHKLTACLIFDMTMAEYEALDDTEKERRRTIAKRVNFGIPYGVSGKGISGMLKGEGIEVSEEMCDTYVDIFFEKKPRVKEWIERVRNSTAASAESLSMFGRKRRLEPVYSVRSQVVERTLRQAINHPIQSTASDLTQTALCIMDMEIQARRGAGDHIDIHPDIRAAVKVDERWNEVDMILTVHDSIMLDCRRSMAEKVIAMALRITSNVVDLAPMVWGDVIEEPLRALHRVPIVAEAKVGPNWRDGHKVKDPKKDVPVALYIGDRRRELFDADPHFKWTKDYDKKFAAEFAAKAA